MSRFMVAALLLLAGFSIDAQVIESPPPQGFLQTEFTPGASLEFALGLIYDQATVAVPQWGSGRAGLERRAEWLGVGWTAGAITEYAIATSRGVDTRYRPCACKGFPRRATHALHAGLIEYRSDGQAVPALARFSGIVAGTAATIPMLPSGYGLRDAAGRAVIAFGVDEGFNVLHEFRKEIIRMLLLRGNPTPRPAVAVNTAISSR